MVMNRERKQGLPDQTGPEPSTNRVKAGIRSSGATNTMPIASAVMVPILRNVER